MLLSTFKSTLLVALLCLFQSAHAGEYTVALQYALASDDADCIQDSAHILGISELAMFHAGMDLGQDKKHWQGYRMTSDHEMMEEVILDDEIAEKYNHAHLTSERRLCNSFCQFMCNSVGTYCTCCTCCGRERRRLGGVRSATISDDLKLQGVKDAAKAEALKLLGRWHHHIKCLAEPYDVTVVIASQEDLDAAPEAFADNGVTKSEEEESCAAEYGQCGGKKWEGATCCGAGLVCDEQKPWYHQCVKDDVAPEEDHCGRQWAQCGGENYSGETCCVSGNFCDLKSQWYSQCMPDTN